MRGGPVAVALFVLACGSVTEDGIDASVDAPPGVAQLSGLDLGAIALVPDFDPSVTSYTAIAPLFVDELIITPDAAADQFIRVEGSLNDPQSPSDPIALALGATTATVEVVGFGLTPTTYTIEVTRGRDVLEYVKASNTETQDEFGTAVAIDGDLMAVGSRLEDSSTTVINGDQNDNTAIQAGAVYVFARDGNGAWSQEAYIKPAVIDASDTFGVNVALSGNTLAVSSNLEDSAAVGINNDATDNTAGSAGAVWIFVRDGAGVWSQEAYIKASNTGQGDNFGESMDLDGETLVVGAPDEDSAATGVGGNQADDSLSGAGAAYVFVRDNGVWTQQAYLKASNTEASDQFGQSVAISGDTIVVGADDEDSGAIGINGDQADNAQLSSGALYVFVRDGVVWSQQAYVKASNSFNSDVFGRAVDISGDTIVAGAELEDSAATGVDGNQADNTASSSGAVYVFVRQNDVWTQQAYIKASNPTVGDFFGRHLAIDGDTLVVTAPDEDSAATGLEGDQADETAPEAGAAYVFRRRDGVWRQTTYVKPNNSSPADRFGEGFVSNNAGEGVAISGDTIVIGANDEDGAGVGFGADPTNDDALSAGAVYVFQ